MSTHSPTLSAIIISYNTREMTLDCLRALKTDLANIEAEIWVVDNDSKDGSAAAIRAQFPDVKLIENPRNAGFGAANNLAMKDAAGRYFLLLNSDAFPKTGACGTLIEYLETHPRVGAVGPRLLNDDGTLQVSCWKFPAPRRSWYETLGLAALLSSHRRYGDYYRWAHDRERRVDFVIGACLLLRREVYQQVGGFDEDFFLYAEETDWQRRMTKAGWPIVFVPDAQVTHLGGASGAGDKARINRHFYDGMDRYIAKHHGRGGLISMRAATFVGCLIRLPIFALLSARPGSERARAKLHLLWWLARRQVRPFTIND